jgi:hypothetical protein
MKSFLLVAGLAFGTSLFAADPSKILISGKSISVEAGKATGAARAVAGDLTVTADAITFDRPANVLKCEGAVTIRMAGNVVTARDCSIALGDGEKRVAFLSTQSSIRVGAGDAHPFPIMPTDLIGSSADRQKLIQDFNGRSGDGPRSPAAPEQKR